MNTSFDNIFRAQYSLDPELFLQGVEIPTDASFDHAPVQKQQMREAPALGHTVLSDKDIRIVDEIKKYINTLEEENINNENLRLALQAARKIEDIKTKGDYFYRIACLYRAIGKVDLGLCFQAAREITDLALQKTIIASMVRDGYFIGDGKVFSFQQFVGEILKKPDMDPDLKNYYRKKALEIKDLDKDFQVECASKLPSGFDRDLILANLAEACIEDLLKKKLVRSDILKRKTECLVDLISDSKLKEGLVNYLSTLQIAYLDV